MFRSFVRLLTLSTILLLGSCSSKEKCTYVTKHLHERETLNCYPHVSGDVFRHFADHVVDDTRQPFDAKSVEEGDVIFLKTKYLGKFLRYMHPKISSRYLLITGNGDEEAPGDFAHLLDDEKLIHWFAMNATASHPKLTAIPIGGGGMLRGDKERLLFELISVPPKKTTLLYINFRPDNHKERAKALATFQDSSFCWIDDPCSTQDFLQRVSSSKYVLCPRGNGLDTHRVWETLLLGSIPVIKRGPLDHLLSKLPVLFVDEWSEVTKELLETRYEEICSGEYDFEKLYADYWLEKIHPFDREAARSRSYVSPEYADPLLAWR